MPHPGAALSNVLLLLDLAPRPRVGHLGLSGTALLRALAAHADVTIEVGDSNHLSTHQGLDLLIVYGWVEQPAWQSLKPGGWLVTLVDRQAGGPARAPSKIPGVVDLRRWLVGPDLTTPHSVIPMTQSALRAHEMISRDPGWKRSLRLCAIALGWQTRDFGGEILAERRP